MTAGWKTGIAHSTGGDSRRPRFRDHLRIIAITPVRGRPHAHSCTPRDSVFNPDRDTAAVIRSGSAIELRLA